MATNCGKPVYPIRGRASTGPSDDHRSHSPSSNAVGTGSIGIWSPSAAIVLKAAMEMLFALIQADPASKVIIMQAP
jgi:hypothetical protein